MQQQSLYQSLPSKPGVYLFKNNKNRVIYVGKAKDLRKRVSSYFKNSKDLDPKTAMLIVDVCNVDYILTRSEIDAYLLEANLIKKYKPFYNIKLADDKFYPYIKIIKADIPYIAISRKKDDLPAGPLRQSSRLDLHLARLVSEASEAGVNAIYFGPYPNASSLKIVLKIIRRIFPYQSVKNHPKRKCLYYHLHLCPCIPVFPQNLKEYKKNIKRIEQFLLGKTENIIRQLEKERNLFSKNEEFEKANDIQEKINKIEIITSEYYDPFRYETDPYLYKHRIDDELKSLREILSPYYPNIDLKRIECYDISNISGKMATGSMVVFIGGDASKKDYRKFKIRAKKLPNDYLMIQEILERRLKRSDWEEPGLIIIDGGKGQVTTGYRTLAKYGRKIPIIGLAKKEERIVISKSYNSTIYLFEKKLNLSNPGLNLLRRIRDEAHRFAISYHKYLRNKSLSKASRKS